MAENSKTIGKMAKLLEKAGKNITIKIR